MIDRITTTASLIAALALAMILVLEKLA